MKTARMALLSIAIATATPAMAHDGAGPHAHGSADPRPLAAIEPARDDWTTEEEAASMRDRVEEPREKERNAPPGRSIPRLAEPTP